MNHLFLGIIMSVTAPNVAQQTTMPADSKLQKTLKTVSNGFVMIVFESMLNPKNKYTNCSTKFGDGFIPTPIAQCNQSQKFCKVLFKVLFTNRLLCPF